MKKLSFLIVVLLILISGCARRQFYSYTGDKAEILDGSRFQDLPIPSGFRLIPASSFVYESKEVRVGMLEYRGRSWPQHVVKFYKKNMPKYNWRILNIIESKETILSFQKNTEICIVTFEARGGGKGVLHLSVSPLSEGAHNSTELISERGLN